MWKINYIEMVNNMKISDLKKFVKTSSQNILLINRFELQNKVLNLQK